MFGDPCPGTGKYVEIHYHCVHSQDVTTQKPPWFFDLKATLEPEYKQKKHTTTETIPISVSLLVEIDSDTNDTTQVSSTKSPESGRYFVINDHESKNNSEEEDNTLTLIITITISTLSTIVSIVIFFYICRKYSKQNSPQQNLPCYSCQQEKSVSKCFDTSGTLHVPINLVMSDKTSTTPEIPIHNTRYISQEAKSLPYLNTIYSDPIEQPYQLYSLSADIIGSDNYITRNDRHSQMICHTVDEGDNVDVSVIKPAAADVWGS